MEPPSSGVLMVTLQLQRSVVCMYLVLDDEAGVLRLQQDVVPLSRQALRVLAVAREGVRGDSLVFPGSRFGSMLGEKVMTQALRQAGGDGGVGARFPFEL